MANAGAAQAALAVVVANADEARRAPVRERI